MEINTHQDIKFVIDGISDFFSDIIIISRTLQIISCIAGVVHQGEKIIIHSNQLVIFALDIRHFHIVGGGADILKFLS